MKITLKIALFIDLDDRERAMTLAEQLVENAFADWTDCPRCYSAEVIDVDAEPSKE
jgi:hypothetical protein